MNSYYHVTEPSGETYLLDTEEFNAFCWSKALDARHGRDGESFFRVQTIILSDVAFRALNDPGKRALFYGFYSEVEEAWQAGLIDMYQEEASGIPKTVSK